MANSTEHCLVCSNGSRGLCYGVRTCAACAEFFRTSIVGKLFLDHLFERKFSQPCIKTYYL